MGAFDDLVPSGKGGAFDDLIPDEPGFLSTLKQHTQGAMDDVGKAIQKGASMLPGMGGQLAAQVSPETYSGASAAGADIIGAIPGIGAGVIAGTGVAAAHGDPVGGLEVAKEVMSKSTPTALAGIDMSKNPAYAAGMKPFEVLTHGIEQAAKVPGKFGKALYGLEDTSKVDAATELAILAGTFGLGSKGRKTASPYDGLRKTHSELKGKTDAEIVDWLEAKKDAPPPERIQGELFDVTPPEGQYGTRDPLLSLREEAAGELRSIEESAAHNREALSGGQKELFPERTGLEVIDNGLERPNKVVSDPLTPEGITNPKEYEHGFGSTRVVSEDRAPLRIEEPGERPSTIPYSNTIFDYVYSRFPELTERLQRDTVAQRLMATVQQLTDHMNETRSMAGRELIKGVEVKRGTTELMPGAEVPGKPDIVNSKRAQAEMDRLKAEYDTSAQRLDVTIQQLSNRLKSRAKALGIDIADNAKFSDWINDRLNSSGPAGGLGKDITGKPYVEGSASANIKKSVAWGRKQRGVIDPDLLTFGVSALIRKLGDRAVWEKFKGTFAPDVMKFAIRDALDPKSRTTLVWMSPDEFHEFAKKRGAGAESDATAWVLHKDKRTSIRDGLKTPDGLRDMPMLTINDTPSGWMIEGHEGRHRMDVFKEQGMDKVPVLIRASRMRWGETPSSQWPKEVYKEEAGVNGEYPSPFERYPFPEPMFANTLRGYMGEPPLGQTKIGGSQRGSIGWKSETPFEKFEKSLPAPYKPMAEKLWRDLEAKKEQKSFIENKGDATVSEFVHNIADAKSWYVPIVKPFKEAREFLLSGKDISDANLRQALGQATTPGGKIYAKQNKNPVLKYGVDIVYAADRAAKVAVEKAIHGPDGIYTAWNKLSKKDFISLMKLVNQFRMKKDLSREDLLSHGMNEKQINAYQTTQRRVAEMADRLDAERVAHGQPPVNRMPGYWGSNWGGDFFFEVYKKHADGRKELVRIEDGDWAGYTSKGPFKGHGLKGIRERFIKENPQYEVGPITKRQTRGYNKDAIALHDQLRDLIDKGSPDRAVLERIFDAYSEEIADRSHGFRHHFEKNTGVEGYRGNKLERSDWKNARDMLFSMEGYFKDANHYIETKRAARDLNKMFFDEEISKIHPNAMKYVRRYWDNYNGMPSLLESAIDNIAGHVGLSGNLTSAGVHQLRHWMSIFFLALGRPVFVAAQRLQAAQFGPPALMKMETDLGAGRYGEAAVHSAATGMLDRSYAAFSLDKMSPLGKEALAYLKDKHIVDVSWLDDVRHAGSRNVQIAKKILTGEVAIKWADTSSRLDTYFAFVHLLDKAGLKGKDNFSAAADAMNQTMVDYSKLERPLMYKSLGLIGDLASPLQTFTHNYFGQLYMYGKDALTHASNPAYAKGLLTFLVSAYYIGGVMGVPFRQDFDWIIDTAKEHNLLPASTKNVTQWLLTSSKDFQGTKRDIHRYGVFAGATGMDVSPTLGAAMLIPDRGIEGRFPYIAKPLEIASTASVVGAKTVGKMFGGEGPTVTDKGKFVQAASPPAWKIFKEMNLYNPETGQIESPNQHMAGRVRRGPPSMTDRNWVASALGTNSIKESEEARVAWQTKVNELTKDTQLATLLNTIISKRQSGQNTTKEVREYVAMGGDERNIENAYNKAEFNRQITNYERAKGIPKTVRQVQKYRDIEEYGVTK